MSLKGLSGIFLRVILPVFGRAGHDNRPTLKHALGKRNLGGYEATVDNVLRGGGNGGGDRCRLKVISSQ